MNSTDIEAIENNKSEVNTNVNNEQNTLNQIFKAETVENLYSQLRVTSDEEHKKIKSNIELKNSYYTFYDSCVHELKVNLNKEELERKFSLIKSSINDFNQCRKLIKEALINNEDEISSVIKYSASLFDELSYKFSKFKTLVSELEHLIKECETEKRNTSDIKKMINIVKTLEPIENMIVLLNKHKETTHQLIEIRTVKEGIFQDKLYILNSNKEKVAVKTIELEKLEEKLLLVNNEIESLKSEIINVEELSRSVDNQIQNLRLNNQCQRETTLEFKNFQSKHSTLLECIRFSFTDLFSAIINLGNQYLFGNQIYQLFSHVDIVNEVTCQNYNNQIMYCNQRSLFVQKQKSKRKELIKTDEKLLPKIKYIQEQNTFGCQFKEKIAKELYKKTLSMADFKDETNNILTQNSNPNSFSLNEYGNNYNLEDSTNKNNKYPFILSKYENKYSLYYYLVGLSILLSIIKIKEKNKSVKDKEVIFNLENDISRVTVILLNLREINTKNFKQKSSNKAKLEKYENLIKSLSKVK